MREPRCRYAVVEEERSFICRAIGTISESERSFKSKAELVSCIDFVYRRDDVRCLEELCGRKKRVRPLEI